MQQSEQHDHDVIIVGGGMVGAALAARLGHTGFSVGLVEQGDAPTPPSGDYDLRISSLNARSLAFIKASGTTLPEERCCPFRHIDVSNQDGTGHSLFSAEDSGMKDFGIFIENSALQYALWQRIEQLPSVTCYTQCAPLSTVSATNRRLLELDNGKTLSARLIVGADGASSTLRSLAGISVTSYDYHQRAMIINVETELPQQDVSWQVFTPTGPLAMLPLPGHNASLVWYDREETTRAREQLDDDALKAAIEMAFPKRLGNLIRIVARASFPIKRQHAHRYISKHDADTLAEIIVQGRDPGDYVNLLRFECQRRAANQAMIAATDTFHHLFTGSKPLRQLGDLSLQIAERFPFAKRMMMQQANGLNPFKMR